MVYLSAALLEQPASGIISKVSPDDQEKFGGKRGRNPYSSNTNNATASTTLIGGEDEDESNNKRRRSAQPNDNDQINRGINDDTESQIASERSSSSFQVASFWSAHAAISGTCLATLRSGLHLSRHLLLLQNKYGLDLLRKKVITKRGPFRYVILDEGPDIITFGHPLLLSRLAMFLLDCLIEMREKEIENEFPSLFSSSLLLTSSTLTMEQEREREKKLRSIRKPLVVACLIPSRSVYLIVGIQSTLRLTERRERNRFARAFRRAADVSGAKIKHDAFETSWMEVDERDIRKFFEYLHSGMIVI